VIPDTSSSSIPSTSLSDGPYTDEGTITLTGLFMGFNGEECVVVGGTGAYAGLNGTAKGFVGDRGSVIRISAT